VVVVVVVVVVPKHLLLLDRLPNRLTAILYSNSSRDFSAILACNCASTSWGLPPGDGLHELAITTDGASSSTIGGCDNNRDRANPPIVV